MDSSQIAKANAELRHKSALDRVTRAAIFDTINA